MDGSLLYIYFGVIFCGKNQAKEHNLKVYRTEELSKERLLMDVVFAKSKFVLCCVENTRTFNS